MQVSRCHRLKQAAATSLICLYPTEDPGLRHPVRPAGQCVVCSDDRVSTGDSRRDGQPRHQAQQ